MARQLNIRSDEAYQLAHEIARREHRSVTDVVVLALQKEAAKLPPVDGLSPRQRADYDHLRAAARRAAATKKLGATSDHSDIYDERGLPK
ncbi:MAG: type II toxin-antitoxin system VapB family antitoxin [Bauldia sp.]|jgi:hypothetical protein